jgi:hypothetical protein
MALKERRLREHEAALLAEESSIKEQAWLLQQQLE